MSIGERPEPAAGPGDPITANLLAKGITDMVRISSAVDSMTSIDPGDRTAEDTALSPSTTFCKQTKAATSTFAAENDIALPFGLLHGWVGGS